MAALVALVDGMKVGDPLDPATDIGPLVSPPARAGCSGYIEAGRNSDAKLVVGRGDSGRSAARLVRRADGLRRRHNSDRIAREEIFGPVLG